MNRRYRFRDRLTRPLSHHTTPEPQHSEEYRP